jgi:hypothetical protein
VVYLTAIILHILNKTLQCAWKPTEESSSFFRGAQETAHIDACIRAVSCTPLACPLSCREPLYQATHNHCCAGFWRESIFRKFCLVFFLNYPTFCHPRECPPKAVGRGDVNRENCKSLRFSVFAFKSLYLGEGIVDAATLLDCYPTFSAFPLVFILLYFTFPYIIVFYFSLLWIPTILHSICSYTHFICVKWPSTFSCAALWTGCLPDITTSSHKPNKARK